MDISETLMDDNKELLTFKNILTLSNSDLIPTLESLNFQQFLSSIVRNDSIDHDYLEEVTDVIRLISESLPSSYILVNLRNQLKDALASKHSELKSVWLRILSKCLRTPDDVSEFVQKDVSDNCAIIKVIVDIIGQKSEANYKYTSEIITKCAETVEFREVFFSGEMQSQLNQIMNKGSTENMRVLDVITKLACVSQQLLNLADKAGYLEELMKNVLTDDILVQLNALELVFSISSTDFGVSFLHEKGHLQWIMNNIERFHEQSFEGAFLTSSMLTIFGNVGKIDPMLMANSYSDVLQKLCRLSEQESLTVTCIAVFSNIAKSIEGKRVLNECQVLVPKFMAKFAFIIASDVGGKRVEVMNCLSSMLRSSGGDENEEHLTNQWYKHFDQDKKMTKLVIDFSQRPFPDVRLAALQLLHSLTTHMWGHDLLAGEPNFLKTLLDRSKGMDKEGKEAKYAIVKELCTSPYTSKFFKSEDVLLLRKFYKEGPFHIERETNVATESQ